MRSFIPHFEFNGNNNNNHNLSGDEKPEKGGPQKTLKFSTIEFMF